MAERKSGFMRRQLPDGEVKLRMGAVFCLLAASALCRLWQLPEFAAGFAIWATTMAVLTMIRLALGRET